jgi:hypothetical protein
VAKKKKRKYSKKASDKIGRVMKEYSKGKLHSGTGKKGEKRGPVKDRDQAIAIAMSEARKRGMKVPPKKKR